MPRSWYIANIFSHTVGRVTISDAVKFRTPFSYEVPGILSRCYLINYGVLSLEINKFLFCDDLLFVQNKGKNFFY